jgi:hypothetical protein
MVLVSDDLGLLYTGARDLLDEVLTIGREADGDARNGRPARVPDRLSGDEPTTITETGRVLVADPSTGTSRLT